MSYCLDASTLMAMWIERYPKYITWFDPVWEALAAAAADGEVMICRQVVDEVHNDKLQRWLKHCDGLIQEPIEGELAIVAEIMVDERSRELVDPTRERPQADPYVIAQAEIRTGTVVSQEGIRRRAGGKPHMPEVTSLRGVNLLRATAFVRWLAERSGCSQFVAYQEGG